MVTRNTRMPEPERHVDITETPAPPSRKTIVDIGSNVRNWFHNVLHTKGPEGTPVEVVSAPVPLKLDMLDRSTIALGTSGRYELSFDTKSYREHMGTEIGKSVPIDMIIKDKKGNNEVSFGQQLDKVVKWQAVGGTLNTDQIERVLNSSFASALGRQRELRGAQYNPNLHESPEEVFEAIAATNSALPPLRA